MSINYAVCNSDVVVKDLLPPGCSTRDFRDFIIFEHSVKNRIEYIKELK